MANPARHIFFAAACAVAIAVTLFFPLRVAAQDLAPPQGEVLLTINGAISMHNDAEAARFDRAMLETLETVTIETSTIWTEGVQSFTGVPLVALMQAVGARGDSLRATAINDYAIEIPRSDWVEGGPIVAYLNNGKPMSVREKGPLWVIYPYDTNPKYQGEVIYSRSIWQLDRITVE
ncbi:oxidoreductase [Pseudodonghicola flavimaris]|uniref:Oxidoreductase n=1 Tax=Pseudodonghicola flavimaris TaxID=3050036 RepID=A0ABT7F6C1_9RHOB|nr:oxidoreductase [Pseudodonghicola flavimaris]MDK3020152.1 oxidoreductase [Pseudodonghicola flavimaris]